MYFIVANTMLHKPFGHPWLNYLYQTISKDIHTNKIILFIFKIQILINDYSLTAANGEGQQWRAAPACTASMELETKGSLAMSALTKMKFLAKEMFMKYKRKMNKRVVKTSGSKAWYHKILIDLEICVLFWKVIFLLNKFITLP